MKKENFSENLQQLCYMAKRVEKILEEIWERHLNKLNDIDQ